MVTMSDGHQTAQVPGFFDGVVEIREARVAEANQLLAEGWQLQGIYAWSGRVEAKKAGEQGYVRKAAMYVLLKRKQAEE
jgi:hypothetical protein